MQAQDRAVINRLLTAIDGRTSLERYLARDAEGADAKPFDESKVNRAANGEFRAKAHEDAHFAHLGAQKAHGMAHYPTAAARARKTKQDCSRPV
jgi:hypothetical protein